MRVADLKGLPVIDPRVARQAGVLKSLLIDPANGKLAVMEVAHGDGALREKIPVRNLRSISPHVIMVTDLEQVEFSPQPEDDGLLVDTETLFKIDVYTEDGRKLGRICDAELDPDSLAITSYKLKLGLSTKKLDPDDVVSCSREMMIVRERLPVKKGAPLLQFRRKAA